MALTDNLGMVAGIGALGLGAFLFLRPDDASARPDETRRRTTPSGTGESRTDSRGGIQPSDALFASLLGGNEGQSSARSLTADQISGAVAEGLNRVVNSSQNAGSQTGGAGTDQQTSTNTGSGNGNSDAGGTPTNPTTRAGRFVRRTYKNVLGREPDKEGFEFYKQKIRSGERTPANIAGSLAKSPEARATDPGSNTRESARQQGAQQGWGNFTAGTRNPNPDTPVGTNPSGFTDKEKDVVRRFKERYGRNPSDSEVQKSLKNEGLVNTRT